MLRSLLLAAGIGVAALAISSADAAPFHHNGFFGPRIGLGFGFGFAPNYDYYDDGYAYGYRYSCGWLYHRATVTGSPYWWHRYEECRDRY
jgi:hypothetical protein